MKSDDRAPSQRPHRRRGPRLRATFVFPAQEGIRNTAFAVDIRKIIRHIYGAFLAGSPTPLLGPHYQPIRGPIEVCKAQVESKFASDLRQLTPWEWCDAKGKKIEEPRK